MKTDHEIMKAEMMKIVEDKVPQDKCKNKISAVNSYVSIEKIELHKESNKLKAKELARKEK